MRFILGALSAAAAASAQRVPVISDYSQSDIADGKAFKNVSDTSIENMFFNLQSRNGASCTFENAEVRPEWNKLSTADRQGFTAAVECLQQTPPQVMTEAEAPNYPGVKSRYDEFIATHINYTLNIHMTADFFGWHRYFVWALHDDLKTHCGYSGPMPYWNWADTADNPSEAAIFNGDENSLGSNGKYIPGRGDTYLGLQDIDFPPGSGGGCVTSGPFVNYTVNMGPIDSPYNDNVENHMDYNPRCLSRDLNSWFSQRYNSYVNLTEVVLEQTRIEDLQDLFQGYGSDTNRLGCHGGGHWLVGAVMSDFHSSPADPLFYLHHAMVDKAWTIWQNLDISGRQNAIKGTSTTANSPPSADMTLNDQLPFGFVRPSIRFGDVMDTFSGPFCYRYD
ncbi:tyrosinase [Polychaeton citri CBS 116435]|uniref:Tyrosinase n=1 Tax=Polychaeton citri CBS 116435 TaxID=1314669 RepID=A0A9P4UM98_9PEZI|nr:tyrosinase [Polychaeton citri CBS 116435]